MSMNTDSSGGNIGINKDGGTNSTVNHAYDALNEIELLPETLRKQSGQYDKECKSSNTSNYSDMSSTMMKYQPLLTGVSHQGGDICHCPLCLLSYHISYLFSNQRRSSEHVLASWPSSFYTQFGGGLPSLPPIRPSNLKVCPVYETYGFCPYSQACYLQHPAVFSSKSLTRKTDSAEEEYKLLVKKAQRQLDEPLWQCEICGYSEIDENSLSAVGEMFYYRYCSKCSFCCYFPYITRLIEHIIDSVGDDYQRFKDIIDDYRIRLPDEYKVPLSFEAHRIANVVFSWSLISPVQVRDAVDSAYRIIPDMSAIISMGSGSGYIEHIFNRVTNAGVGMLSGDENSPQYVLKPSQFSTNSFIGVKTSFYGKKIVPIYAFDELLLRRTYSVHVSIGGPLSILSMDCARTVLLLCWPPFGSAKDEQNSMSFEALEYFTQRNGKVVIYIGDIASTGDWRFHQLLQTHYKLVRDYPVRREVRRWLPQEMGLVYAGNDTVGVYQSRSISSFIQQNRY
ncbi:unnamed protein product [Phytomonas sp. Hart1]|nr:unnamed protein product [Phytomonas sp. Hart1]|eukprot:CCW68721.1 unnamed protein product [Phytomonas sp. isolate Hart1]